MDKRIKASVISHIGNSRDNQEDNYLVRREGYLPSGVRDGMSKSRKPYCLEGSLDKERFLVAVSDGMGGHSNGEVASLLTVEYLSKNYDDIIDSVRLGERELATQISRINNAVTSRSKNDSSCRGMGATLCGVIANEYELVGFNVGDSRLYQYKDGELKQLSSDHTEGQRLLKMKLLTEEEVRRFPRRKVLHKYIGCDGEIVPDVFRITGVEQGTVLMLCTDGLSDVMSDDEMAQIFKNDTDLSDKATSLVNEAVSRNLGHGDNTTVILVEF